MLVTEMKMLVTEIKMPQTQLENIYFDKNNNFANTLVAHQSNF
jgi:hypothetical protein